MPADSELDAWNASAKAQLRKVQVNKSWEQKLEASVRMRERDRELRASRSSASSSGATTAPNAPRTAPPPASPAPAASAAHPDAVK